MRRQRTDTRHQARPKVRLCVGDTVELLCGREGDRGKQGQITEILAGSQRVRVSGLALQVKHQRARGRRAMQQQAGRIQVPGPIHISNVQLVCPTCGQRTRPRYEVGADGVKRRVCRKCNAEIGRQRVES